MGVGEGVWGGEVFLVGDAVQRSGERSELMC